MCVYQALDAYWDRVRRALARDEPDADELFEFQQGLQVELFGEPADFSAPLAPGATHDHRFEVLLDALQALADLEPTEPAHPWMRATILSSAGRHLEAADDFVLASQRFADVARSRNGLTGDEDDWAESALYRAATSRICAGHYLSASLLLPGLSPENGREVAAELEAALSREARP